MDERIEHGDDSSPVAGSTLGRREMLQRAGFVVGAAALWATPVVQTIGMRPAAATEEFALEACVDANGKLLGAPTSLGFEFEASPCNSDLDLSYKDDPNSPWGPEKENTTEFFDPCCDLSPVTGPFLVEVWGRGGKQFPTGSPDLTFTVNEGDTFVVNGAALGAKANIFFRISVAPVISATANPDPVPPPSEDSPSASTESVEDSPSVSTESVQETSNCVQRFGFHYSCSEPLIIGDRHGSVILRSYVA